MSQSPGPLPDAQPSPAATPTVKVPIYRDLMVLQLALLVFLLDQFTKYLVRELLPFRYSFPYDGFARITHTYNTGSAFGILQGQNTPLIFVSFVGILILALIYCSQPRPSGLLRFSLALQLGGAFGNLLDRLRLGHVTDFIDIGPWPVFNLADASIVSGLLILAWVFLRPGQPAEVATVAATAPIDGYAWCPVCDGEMVSLTNGWRCATCGARERIDRSYSQGIGAIELDSFVTADGDGRERPSASARAGNASLPSSLESPPEDVPSSEAREARPNPGAEAGESGVAPSIWPGREGNPT